MALDLDVDAFLAACQQPPQEADPRDQALLDVLVDTAQERLGARVAEATGYAADRIREDSSAAWVVATLFESTVIAVVGGLRPGEVCWHVTKCLNRLAGSPLALAPGELGVFGSLRVPDRCWPVELAHEADSDERAVQTLRSMGLGRRAARRYARSVC